MNNKPLVSVITPFFNTPLQFMLEAIESVLTQSYDNWEMLLIDDGSYNGSTDLAQQYAEKYPARFRYLHHEGRENRGASAARNLGIAQSNGDYIAFLDADDVWLPQKLEEQLKLFVHHPEAVMVYGNSLYWYSWDKNKNERRRDFMPRLGVPHNKIIQPPKLLPLFLEGRAAVPVPCSILVRRWSVENVGGFEDAVPVVYDDQVFYAKICLLGPVFVSGDCWDRYRQHPDSSCLVAEESGRMDEIRLSFLQWLAKYLSEQKVTDDLVWGALRRELRHFDGLGRLHGRGLVRYIERRTRKLWFRMTGNES